MAVQDGSFLLPQGPRGSGLIQAMEPAQSAGLGLAGPALRAIPPEHPRKFV